jgi:hypothetical protein
MPRAGSEMSCDSFFRAGPKSESDGGRRASRCAGALGNLCALNCRPDRFKLACDKGPVSPTLPRNNAQANREDQGAERDDTLVILKHGEEARPNRKPRPDPCHRSFCARRAAGCWAGLPLA